MIKTKIKLDAVLILGLVNVGLSLYFYAEIMMIKKWPHVEGIVVSASIDRALRPVVTGGKGGNSSEPYRYWPVISYRYEVDNHKYINDRYSIFPGGEGLFVFNGKLEKIEEIIKDYPVNKRIPIYYNPKNPRKSLIEVSGKREILSSNIGLGMGLILILIDLWAQSKREKSRNPEEGA